MISELLASGSNVWNLVDINTTVLTLLCVGCGLTILLLIANYFLANYGECKLDINSGDREIVIDGGCTLLDALYQNEVYIPSACGGQGTCGFCKVGVTDGGGEILPTEIPYLTSDDLAKNVRLACQVKVKQDMTLKIREDFLNVKEFAAELTEATMVSPDCRELHFKLIEPEEMDFRPGQYIQIRVPSGEFRAYSICSAVSSKNSIELLVRLLPGGLGSTYLHEIEVGDEVSMTGPYGEFVLDTEKDLICVGGGCGMAPMRSLVRTIHELGTGQNVWLFFGARTPEHGMYYDEFLELAKEMPGLHVHYSMSEPQDCPEWTGATGFIHEAVAHNISGGDTKQAFLCGPPMMIEATMDVLETKGMNRDEVFFDEF
ncbi:MAG: 2Fe-2S iron-sulfur cluster binding domain-containing protein [Phycisphaerales bacterium]|jgi:Na+-transporting NADH:ubiquinone oxidoreductase subunit F|nr:2Fe-2S iron-sulfur cluster binding domain-containing protein [Phycisphaerales bacterium]MBT7170955.1 2Fe-2S iron-sulfur cluster binding domain-containing protein [Phycisphaerales bacterium]